MTSGIYNHKPHSKETIIKIKENHKGGPQKGHIVLLKTKEKIKKSCKNAIVIYHINGNHFDNRPKNRMIVTPREHAIIHILQSDINPYGKKKGGNRIR